MLWVFFTFVFLNFSLVKLYSAEVLANRTENKILISIFKFRDYECYIAFSNI